MALLVCEDCGHKVSDLALDCPKCGRPTGGTAQRASEAARRDGSAPAVLAGLATQSVVPEAWLGDLKKARDVPSRGKVCERCNADVSADAFRKRTGTGYLCADCIDEDEERRRARGELLMRMLVTIVVLLFAGAVTAGAVHVLPMLQTSKGVKTAK